ncbi:MAG: GntR family transcriptional regulator [Planctomycetota bacterium]|jgi:GntR family transcriptional regulator
MKLRELVRIDPDSPMPVYAQVEEQLARLIASSTYGPGEKIPSVRELAVALRVNPLTVSKAYGRLADRGLVKTHRGKGVFVAEGKPTLSKKEKDRAVSREVDRLIMQARQLGLSAEELLQLVQKRWKRGGRDNG